jgi:CheY-like chemotaxis protein
MNANAVLPPLMLVDDDDNDALLVARRLKQAGVAHPLIHFHDGADAFLFLKQFCPPEETQIQLPALMLLDVNMPGLSGFDVLIWARQQPALDRMKIVMLSGVNEEWDAAIAAKLGADDYLEKFPEPEVFADLIASPVPLAARELRGAIGR